MRIDQPELSFAVDLAKECSLLARHVQERMVTAAVDKDDRSPVTVADFAVQALAGYRLSQALPEATLVAEESADFLRSEKGRAMSETVAAFVSRFESRASADSVRAWIDRGQGQSDMEFWVLDPIDGTKGFLRNAQYAVAIALVRNGEVELGVLGCPRLRLSSARGQVDVTPSDEGCLLMASKGKGCFLIPLEGGQPERLKTSEIEDPVEAVLVRSVVTGHTNVDQLGELQRRLGIQADPILMDSQAKYGLLAAGQGDLLARLISESRPDYKEKIWDQAAGSLIVEEAGGKITDLDGKALDFTVGRKLVRNRGILASNGNLHHSALGELSRIETTGLR